MRLVEGGALELSQYRMVSREAPKPGPGEILIKVAACGIGYVDALVALGRYQVKPPLPHTPGQEAAGWVEALGDGVAGPSPGTRVMASVRGGFAEYALASASAVSPIPDSLSFAQAAGFRINHLTALHALKDRAQARPGEVMLVFGAAGGVGSAAIQVGKLLDLTVVAAASSDEKRAFCKAAGADLLLDTSPEGWRDRLKGLLGGRGPDVVFDPVCGPLFEAAFRSLRWGGRHLVVGFAGGMPALPVNLPLMKGAALVGVDVRQFLLIEPASAAAHEAKLLDWAAAGRLTPAPGRIFPIESFESALEYALSGAGMGKTILQVS